MKNLKNVNRASSFPNGILFYSNLCSGIAYKSYINNENRIITQAISCDNKKETPFLLSRNLKSLPHFRTAILIYNIAWCILVLLSKKDLYSLLAIAFFFFFTAKDLFFLLFLFYQMKLGEKKLASAARFHAAEHMSINAYRKFQRVPTFDEIKKESRFTKECGSMTSFERIIINSIISISIIFIAPQSLFNFLIFCVISCAFLIILSNTGCLNFLQILVTSKPTDLEILVALDGIKFFDIAEDYIKNTKK